MSTDMIIEDNSNEEVVEIEDEYLISYEKIENNLDISSIDFNNKITDYQLLLSNPRFDEQAIKIKEQCIYRYVLLYSFDNNR